MTLTVVGTGRIGRVLASRVLLAGQALVAVSRKENRDSIEKPGGEGPIVIAVREEHLPELLPRIHPSHAPRLVFVQNGFVGEWMERIGARGRGLLHFNAADDGTVRVLLPSVFGGSDAAREACGILERGGIPSRFEEDPAKFRVEEIRKALWSCVLSLLAARKKIPVGRLFAESPEEIEALTRECAEIAGAAFGVKTDVGDLLASLRTMAARLPDYGGSARGWEFRNLWLVRRARSLGIPTPQNDRALRECGIEA